MADVGRVGAQTSHGLCAACALMLILLPWAGGAAAQPLASAQADRAAALPSLALEEAVALAAQHSLVAIAARLDIAEAEVEEIAAGMWENPELGAQVSNLVLGRGYDQEMGIDPSFFEQRNIGVELRQLLDVWCKRSARRRAAALATDASRLAVADVLRQLRYEVASAYGDVVRSQGEGELARQSRQRFRQTLSISSARRRLGDISQAELEKVELEELRYIEQEIGAEAELGASRLRLAGLLALAGPELLPAALSLPAATPMEVDVPALAARAVAARPDLRQLARAEEAAAARERAERRDALPDVAATVSYNDSKFQASGDNPHTLGVGISLPLPLFSRNQAEVARARLARRRLAAEAEALARDVRLEIAQAAVDCRQAATRLTVLRSGMQARAERAQALAERSWRAGATSLLEFLDADRTYLEVCRDLLQAEHAWRQAAFALARALGEEPSRP